MRLRFSYRSQYTRRDSPTTADGRNQSTDRIAIGARHTRTIHANAGTFAGFTIRDTIAFMFWGVVAEIEASNIARTEAVWAALSSVIDRPLVLSHEGELNLCAGTCLWLIVNKVVAIQVANTKMMRGADSFGTLPPEFDR